MIKKTLVMNGDQVVDHYTYVCIMCGCDLPEENPLYKGEGKDFFCCDCALISGKMTGDEYIKTELYSFSPESIYVEVIGGKIVFSSGKNKNRSKKGKRRFTTEYKVWRRSVFDRDKYKCQECGQIGGVLNAHHIKSYKTYRRLRLSLKNGITLCYSCHRGMHAKQ